MGILDLFRRKAAPVETRAVAMGYTADLVAARAEWLAGRIGAAGVVLDIRTGEVIDWANFPPGIQVLNIVRGEKGLRTYKVSVRDGEVRVGI